MSNLSDLELARTVCVEGGKVAVEYFRTSTTAENKASGTDYDPVTEGDRAAERKIRALLKEHRPDDGILGEEYGLEDGTSNRQWIIDPIDGTRAFVSNSPTWGTLVGLKDSDQHAIGAAGQAVVGDVFSGDGTQSWLNGHPIQTRHENDRAQLRIATTDLAILEDSYVEKFEALSREAAIRRLGLDWYSYALLACGGFDVVVETGLQPYDIAALVPIIRGAGGVVTDLKGGDDLGPTVLATSHPKLHEDILKLFNS